MTYRFFPVGLLALGSLAAAPAEARPVLHFAGSNQTVDVGNYTFSLPSSDGLAVRFSFTGPEADRLAQLLSANAGKPVAVRIGDHPALAPTVKEVPTSGTLELTLSDVATYEAVKAELLTAWHGQ